MTHLLDTNVVSELRKRHANDSVVAWVNELTPSDLFVSAITVLEIERGILRVGHRDLSQADVLRNWFEGKVLGGYGGRILSVDVRVARQAAALHMPDPAPERDVLIAATALVHGMTLVTRNVRDFEATGVPVRNPWN